MLKISINEIDTVHFQHTRIAFELYILLKYCVANIAMRARLTPMTTYVAMLTQGKGVALCSGDLVCGNITDISQD